MHQFQFLRERITEKKPNPVPSNNQPKEIALTRSVYSQLNFYDQSEESRIFQIIKLTLLNTPD